MNSDIIKAIKAMAGTSTLDSLKIAFASVTSVNETERSCDVELVSGEGGHPMSSVMLMAENDDGVLYLPAIDSTVIVAFNEAVAPFVLLFSEVQKALTIVGDSGIEMTSDQIKLNDGSYGGLVKVIELTSRLNAVENALIELKATFNAHTHTGVTTGGGVSGTTATPLTSTVTNTNRSDIENETIIHGGGI